MEVPIIGDLYNRLRTLAIYLDVDPKELVIEAVNEYLINHEKEFERLIKETPKWSEESINYSYKLYWTEGGWVSVTYYKDFGGFSTVVGLQNKLYGLGTNEISALHYASLRYTINNDSWFGYNPFLEALAKLNEPEDNDSLNDVMVKYTDISDIRVYMVDGGYIAVLKGEVWGIGNSIASAIINAKLNLTKAPKRGW